MKTRLCAVLLVSLLFIPVLISCSSLVDAQTEQQGKPEVFVGIDVAYENITEIKNLIDKVSIYTNLFVIGCTGITNNETTLNEVCQYVYDKELFFIVYRERAPQTQWMIDAKTKWGDRFLGFYFSDEFGGRQLDQVHMVVQNAEDHTNAAYQFQEIMTWVIENFQRNYNAETDFPLFTSDYALYWFDYKAGYDTVLAQFGWNYSRQLNVALCRGAATVQNKDWGTIIVWENTVPPYIGFGQKLYEDLVLAYKNGAKYIMVFDSDEEYAQSILKQEHLDALKRFWEYVQDNPRLEYPVSDRVGFVLPKDYAYGFRGPTDKIWGLWEADVFDQQLSVNVNSLLEQYGVKLDIIYDDRLETGNNYGYQQLIFWNDTTQFPLASLNPSPTQSASPGSTPTTVPAQTSTTPTLPTTTPSLLTPSPTSATNQTNTPTSSVDHSPSEFPLIAVVPILIAAILVGVLFYRKKVSIVKPQK